MTTPPDAPTGDAARPETRSRWERFGRWITFAEGEEVANRVDDLRAALVEGTGEVENLQLRNDRMGAEYSPDLNAEQLLDLHRRIRELGDEVTAVAERREVLIAQLDQARTHLRAIRAKRDRLNRRLAMLNFGLELGTLVLLLLFPWFGHKAAERINVDFYAAVTTIAPVVLVAGFVEIAVLRLKGAVWIVLTFAVPTVAATVAALWVLATHTSTPDAFTLVAWGLGVAIVALVLYAATHAGLNASS